MALFNSHNQRHQADGDKGYASVNGNTIKRRTRNMRALLPMRRRLAKKANASTSGG